MPNIRVTSALQAFRVTFATCEGSSFLPLPSPISNFFWRYARTFREKRVCPPRGLCSAHPVFRCSCRFHFTFVSSLSFTIKWNVLKAPYPINSQCVVKSSSHLLCWAVMSYNIQMSLHLGAAVEFRHALWIWAFNWVLILGVFFPLIGFSVHSSCWGWKEHGGARTPLLCARNAWVVFFKMAPKKSAKASGCRHIGFISRIGRALADILGNWYEQCSFGGHFERVELVSFLSVCD